MKTEGRIWDAVSASQDGGSLATYRRRRAETMVGEHELSVGDCVSETIMRCFESADNEDELLANLRYAVHELSHAAFSAGCRSGVNKTEGGA